MSPRQTLLFASLAGLLLAGSGPGCGRHPAAPPPPRTAHAAPSPAERIPPARTEPPADGIPAALRQLAARDPDRAAALALAQPAPQRLEAVTAVLVAVAEDPDMSVRLARQFCERDPALVREHGSTLVAALTAAGHFRSAVGFAELGGPERAAWLELALRRWARVDSAAALAAARALDDTDAIRGALAGAEEDAPPARAPSTQ